MERRQKQAILAAFLIHPSLVEDFGEALGYLELGDPFLDKLRLDILDIHADEESVNAQYLKKRLFERGYTDNFEGVLEDKINSSINSTVDEMFGKPYQKTLMDNCYAFIFKLIPNGKEKVEETSKTIYGG